MSGELSKVIKKKASQWAGKLTTLAKANAPRHIAPYISSKSKASDGRYEIIISVKPIEKVSETGAISNYGTTDAKAQEYGHPGATITPRVGRKYLAFPWEVGVVSAPRLPNGFVLLKKVRKLPQPAYNDGKGYIRPAVQTWRSRLRSESPEIAKAIFTDLRNGFNTSGKVKWVVK